MEFAGFNMAVDQQRIKGLRQATTRYLRDWPSGDYENSWAGMRPLTPDGLPLIGLAPNCDNLFVATGHGMLGLTLSPATGVAIAQLMRTGKSDFDLEAFRPDRFV